MIDRRAFLCTALVLLAVMQTACMEMLRSDNANFARTSEHRRQDALRNNRLASQQAATARAVGGIELRRLLAGRTHVSEFRKRSGDSLPYYVEYDHFGEDGRFQALNTYERRDPATTAVGVWRVDGQRLCITETRTASGETCFAVRVEAGGAIQYWNDQPGDDFHGLLARRIHIVLAGAILPAFITTPEQMR